MEKIIRIFFRGSQKLQQEISRLWPKNCSANPHDLEAADLVIFDCWGEFQEAYIKDNNKQQFFIISADKPAGLPENVRWFCDMGYDIPLRKLMADFEEGKQEVKFGVLFSPKKLSAKSKQILVVGTDSENLSRAHTCLNEKHLVAIADSHNMALELLVENRYDAIIQIEEAVDEKTVFLILYATRRGANVIFASKPDDVFYEIVHDHSVNGKLVCCVDYTQEKDWELIAEALEEL